MALLIISATFAEQATTNHPLQASKRATLQSTVETISLNDEPKSFSRYNTNGTPSYLNSTSAIFYGSNRTNMYSDMISHNNVKADKSIVLEAQITANVTNFSIGEDPFAVFATDDIINFSSDEFGFVLPEMGNTWYADIQSPQINGSFVWKPLIPANPTEQHSFKAVYSNNVSSQKVDFYVDGKLLWNQMCPDISGKDFHMVLTSHKVSAENIDISQNRMEVKNAVFSDGTKSDQSFDNQNFASSVGMPLLWPLEKSI
jgi:hypothetical protein